MISHSFFTRFMNPHSNINFEEAREKLITCTIKFCASKISAKRYDRQLNKLGIKPSYKEDIFLKVLDEPLQDIVSQNVPIAALKRNAPVLANFIAITSDGLASAQKNYQKLIKDQILRPDFYTELPLSMCGVILAHDRLEGLLGRELLVPSEISNLDPTEGKTALIKLLLEEGSFPRGIQDPNLRETYRKIVTTRILLTNKLDPQQEELAKMIFRNDQLNQEQMFFGLITNISDEVYLKLINEPL